ncbi:hypothetical protein FOZ62_017510, partial [Perkinsus olseni]
ARSSSNAAASRCCESVRPNRSSYRPSYVHLLNIFRYRREDLASFLPVRCFVIFKSAVRTHCYSLGTIKPKCAERS